MKFLFWKGNISITVGIAAPGQKPKQRDPHDSQISTWFGSVLDPLPNPWFYHVKCAVD